MPVAPMKVIRPVTAEISQPFQIRAMLIEWTNAPGAVITRILETTNRISWYVIGVVTNTNRFLIHTTNELAFHRVAHPNEVGHYWDAPGRYRYNPAVFKP